MLSIELSTSAKTKIPVNQPASVKPPLGGIQSSRCHNDFEEELNFAATAPPCGVRCKPVHRPSLCIIRGPPPGIPELRRGKGNAISPHAPTNRLRSARRRIVMATMSQQSVGTPILLHTPSNALQLSSTASFSGIAQQNATTPAST